MDRTAPTQTSTPTMSAADERAHELASYIRTASDRPSQEDEALRRVRPTPDRTISSIPRRDIRTAVSKIRGW